MQLTTYLHFNGNCEEAFRFYETCLGGKILMMMRYDESPVAGNSDPSCGGRIMHARLTVGEAILMGSDMPLHMTPANPQGFAVSIGVDDPAEADRVFAALTEGGKITMPIQETFWAQRFGMLVDRFGTPWMVNCEKPQG